MLVGEDAFFRKVVEGMRCGIVTVDRDAHVLTVNDLARDILDLEAPVRSGTLVREALSCHPRLAEVLVSALEMSHLPNRAEMEIRSREDDGRTIGFTISPISAGDDLLGVALFFKDLTLVERQEEQERLRDRLAALGQMAASMAHEIRNPLASIEVMASLLKRKMSGRAGELELVTKIASEVARLNATVTRGLEFARPLVPELQLQPIIEVLEDSLAETTARFPESKVQLAWDTPAQLPEVPVDAALMRQVFVNILANAFEVLEGKGTITIRLTSVARPAREPGAIDVVIEDDGPGIAPDVQDKIFYPFVTTKESGSGIGLAMARKIVECHHGMIDVEFLPSGGTAFRVRLPLLTDHEADGRG